MISELDIFMLAGSSEGDPVMGAGSITVGVIVLTGVWSGISKTNSMNTDMGGIQSDFSASVVVPSDDAITLSLVGKIGILNGDKLRVDHVDIGEVFTTVFFNHATQL
jgi:hypothetical protein